MLVYRDFIFARPGGTVTLSGLGANAAYEITIYAYDTSSTAGGDRIADWTANGEIDRLLPFRRVLVVRRIARDLPPEALDLRHGRISGHCIRTAHEQQG